MWNQDWDSMLGKIDYFDFEKNELRQNFEGMAICETCPKTPEYQPYIDDPNTTYYFDPVTKTVSILLGQAVVSDSRYDDGGDSFKSNALETSFLIGTAFDVTVAGGKRGFNEVVRQTRINNSLRKPGIALDAIPKAPKVLKFVTNYGGYGFAAYDAFNTNEKWISGEINTVGMAIQQTSNAIGAVPFMGIGTAWSVGWNLGTSFGPSKWYGNDDSNWFK